MLREKINKYIGLRSSELVLLLADAFTVQITLFLVVLARMSLGDVMITLSLYWKMSIILWCAPLFSILFGACQVPPPPPHREVKNTSLTVSLSYLVVLMFLFMTQVSVEYSRGILLIAWLGSIFSVSMVRGLLRRRLCRKSWWGCPTIFLQDEEMCKVLWDEMEEYPARGLKPVAYLNIDYTNDEWQKEIEAIQNKYTRPMFIWCGSEGESVEGSKKFEQIARICKHVLFVPCGKIKKKRFWLAPRVLGTSMGFAVRQNLIDLRRLFVKRCIDILLSSLALIVVIPIGVIVASWIRLSTKSNAIYTQERRGQGGKKIRIYKFCTMVHNADEILEQYLDSNPAYRKEWEENQKLFDDPRITPVGKFLRKTSLDELPQIINVLRGDMSLVGPRPIVEDEIEKYGEVYLEYSAVKPGITGLWQISGRNLTTYEQRVWYDNYYVTNWSVWMDLWIIARTIPVVLRGYGAY